MVNKLIYKLSDYASLDDLLKDVFEQEKILAKRGFVYTFYRYVLDNNLYVLEFSCDTVEDATWFPVWLNNEEMSIIFEERGKEDIVGNLTDSDSSPEA